LIRLTLCIVCMDVMKDEVGVSNLIYICVYLLEY
jgi:hypothetical protein